MKEDLEEALYTAKTCTEWPRLHATLLIAFHTPITEICTETGVDSKDVRNIRASRGAFIRKIRADKPTALRVMLQWPHEMQVLKGLALTDKRTLTPSNLYKLTQAHSILAKSALPAQPKGSTSPAKPSAPPARPE